MSKTDEQVFSYVRWHKVALGGTHSPVIQFGNCSRLDKFRAHRSRGYVSTGSSY
jgi:hypothetical protein